MKQASQKQTGFSLLEVLVAFTIVALSLGVIFQIYATGARSTILGDEYSRAIIVAQSQLAAIGIEETPDIGAATGIESQKYQWTTNIRAIDDEDIDLETRFKIVKREVEVTVSWDSLGSKRSIKLNTIKIIPIS